MQAAPAVIAGREHSHAVRFSRLPAAGTRRARLQRLHLRAEVSIGTSVQTQQAPPSVEPLRQQSASTSTSTATATAREPGRDIKRNLTLSKNFSNANFPVDDQGRTYHLGTKRGEVANRVLSVGSAKRATLLAELLSPCQEGHPLFQLESSRGFITITGLYQGVPVSIICTHMGMPNMDFVVRETKAVVDGQLAVVRLGTCGGLQAPATLGMVVLASPGAVCVRRDPDAFTRHAHSAAASSHNGKVQGAASNGNSNGAPNGSGSSNGKALLNGECGNTSIGSGNGNGVVLNGNGAVLNGNGSSSNGSATGAAGHGVGPAAFGGISPHYQVSLPVPADEELTCLLEHELRFLVGDAAVARGLDASADSFYSSQGRLGSDFDDENEGLLDALVTAYPDCLTLEMETFHLLDLARCSNGQVVAAAAAIVLAQRKTNEFLDAHALYLRERACGAAALNALVKRPLDVKRREGVTYIWD